MKNLYICEKCQAQYESYDECYMCENGHVTEFSFGMEPEMRARYAYKPGQKYPAEIVQQTEIWDDENREYKPVFLRYSFKGELPEKEAAKIKAEYDERKEREKRQWEEWSARQEQKKREKEAAEAAEVTA